MALAVGGETTAALAAWDGVDGQGAMLWEADRAGRFVFDASDLSAEVSADTQQGIFIPPADDTTGVSGAWVRQFSGPIDIRWFGAVADCTAVGVGTDNATAFNAAAAVGLLIGKGCDIYIPKAEFGYRVGSPLVFTSGVKLIGGGFHENPGNVGGTTYTPPQNWRGSFLVFDANIAGLRFIDFTDNNADATAFEYESSRYSVVRDLALYGGGGTSATAHGIEYRTTVHFENVRVENFGGSGFYSSATTAGAVPYGASNTSLLSHCKARDNGVHGFYTAGSDANASTFLCCDGSLNGGVGFLDKSLIGNNYVTCHAATNNQSYGTSSAARTQALADWAGLSDQYAGSFVTSHAGGAENTFYGCYVEGGTGAKAEITTPGICLGGVLSEVAMHTTASNADRWNGGSGGFRTNGLTYAVSSLTLTHANGSQLDVVNGSGGTAVLRLMPGSGTYSNLKLLGNTNSTALGLDLLVGGGAAYFSADSHVFRDAAQTSTSFTADANGINLDTGNRLAIGGTQVVGARGAAIANATDAASAITQLNLLLAAARTHGLIAT